MEKIIRRNIVRGHIEAPPSKSQTIRALAAASLCQSESIIYNYSTCDDANAALDIIKVLGSSVTTVDEDLKILGGKPTGTNILNCRESAFCLRLFSAIASVYDIEYELVAEKSLLKRHTSDMDEIYNSLGVECKTNNGNPPINIRGPLKGGKLQIDCSKSSQLLSGLLFSLPLAKKDSIVKVINLKSKPYIDMSLDVLSKFGIKINNDNYKIIRINGGQSYSPANLNVEGDWSCASNFLLAGAINGEISISNLNLDSLQGDKVIIDILTNSGADISKSDKLIKVRSNELKQFEFDSGDSPDLVPILVVLGCFCEGESIISDVSRLAEKESSRAEIIAKELNSIGGKIRLDGDILRIEQSSLYGGKVNSHYDHRIAMALAVAGLSASSPITIENADCVSKSYPHFWKDFELITQ